MREKAVTFVENICESGCACLVTMVQGNVLALTLGHWLTASQTGLLAGSVAAAAIFTGRLKRRWLVSVTLGVVTMAADFVVHPGKLGIGAVAEAVVTGCGAAALSFAIGALLKRRRTGRAQQRGCHRPLPM